MDQSAKLLSFILLFLLSLNGYAADQGGQGAIGGSCARCHGVDGNSSGGQYPSLAKQKKNGVFGQTDA